MVNGISDVSTRPDLLDRSVLLTLPTVNDANRRDEAELWATFNRARPTILGAMLDAVVVALRNLPTVKLTSLPRMADFAKWVVAGEPGLGWAPAGRRSRAVRSRRLWSGSLVYVRLVRPRNHGRRECAAAHGTPQARRAARAVSAITGLSFGDLSQNAETSLTSPPEAQAAAENL